MNAYTRSFFSLFLAGTVLFQSAPAQALELDQAKQQGLVGETSTGYIAAVSAPTAEVQALVNRINAERKERYQQIAKKNGTPVAAVEGLAAKKALDMTPSGHYVQSGGGWKKK